MTSCFLIVGPGPPPPPPAKIPGSVHGFALGTYNHGSMVQYRVCNIPVKGLWASSVPMRPLTCRLSHHFAYMYMKCHSLAIFIKSSSCCWVGKGEGATHCKV